MTLNPTTRFCKICFKEIKIDDMSRILDKDICICSKCQSELEPKFTRFKINGYKATAIYDYSSFIKNLVYLYKGCFDYELNEVFLNLFFKEIKLKYKGYKIIPIPSYIKDDEQRGFNHVVEAFISLGLESLQIITKTAHHKQADRGFAERHEINKYLVLNSNVSLEKQRVLIVDDIYTTGSTMRAVINLVEKLNPKEIRVLVLAKTRDKDYRKSLLK